MNIPQHRKPRYWVLHLSEQDRAPTLMRPTRLPRFSIQILASDGGPTEQIGYLDYADDRLVIHGHVISLAVVSAVKRLVEGTGIYLDADGEPIEPF